MPQHSKDWRDELEAIDCEIIRLLSRRAQLSVELLRLLRSQESLGSLTLDSDRLLLLLYSDLSAAPKPMSKSQARKLFRCISIECRRIAEREVAVTERNADIERENNRNPN